NIQVRLRVDGCPPIAAAAEVLDRIVARGQHGRLTRDRNAARHVLIEANAGAERERIDELCLELSWTVRRQIAVYRFPGAREHHERVVVRAADVRAGAAALIRLRQAGIIAVQSAPEVACAKVPIAGHPLVERELDAVVVTSRLRHGYLRAREGQ